MSYPYMVGSLGMRLRAKHHPLSSVEIDPGKLFRNRIRNPFLDPVVKSLSTLPSLADTDMSTEDHDLLTPPLPPWNLLSFVWPMIHWEFRHRPS